MYAEITAALASLKSLAEIAKLTSDVKTSAQVIRETIELNATILAIQDKMSLLHSDKDALQQEKKALEQRIAQLENWEAEARLYELKEIASGVFVYEVKPSAAIADPSHWLCPQCYHAKHKSILQRKGTSTRGPVYLCPNCKNEFIDHSNPPPQARVIRG